MQGGALGRGGGASIVSPRSFTDGAFKGEKKDGIGAQMKAGKMRVREMVRSTREKRELQ